MSPTPTHSRGRTARHLGAGLLTLALGAAAALAIPTVAAAEVQDGASFTLKTIAGQTSGTLTELVNENVTIASDLVCPAGTATVNQFLSEPGQELIPPDVTAYSTYFAADYTGIGIEPDGTYELTLGSNNFADRNGNITGLGTALSNVQTEWGAHPAEARTFSYGLFCGDGLMHAVAGEDGKAIVAFGTLSVDTSSNWTFSVPKKASTTTLAATNNGDYAAKLTATVPSDATGKVEFFEGATSLGQVDIGSGGTAELSLTGLSVGTHTYTAKYLGDAAYNESPLSAEQSVEIAFVKLASSVALAAELDDETAAVLTATVSGTGPAPSGEVEFFQDGSSIGTAPITAGVATKPVSGLASGTEFAFTASYAGDTTYNASSTSAAQKLRTPVAPVEIEDGDKLTPGARYFVEVPAGTFEDGETITGVVNSDPITLTETAVAASDGSAVFTFTLPSALASSTEAEHTLVLTGGTSGETYTLAFTITPAAVDDPADGPGSNLATTGTDGAALALLLSLGGGAIALGGGTLAAAQLRKRRNARAAA